MGILTHLAILLHVTLKRESASAQKLQGSLTHIGPSAPLAIDEHANY